MEERDEILISPKMIFEVLRKNLVFIIITVLVFSLGSFFVTNFLVTKHYTSTISLYVETVDLQPDSPNSAVYSLNMQNYALKLVNTYIRMLDTNTFYTKLSNELNEKYGKVPIRMVGGSCDAILYLDGKDITQCKEILGQISGFMIKHSIAAINLPNTIGSPVATYTAESYKAMMNNAPNSRRSSASSAPSTPMTFGATAPTPIANGAPPITENDGNNFAKNFLKKFSKKP